MNKEMTAMKSMVRRGVVATTLLVLSFFGAGIVSAQEVCSGVRGHRVNYLPISGELRTNALDHRTDVDDPEHKVKLQGTLHYPAGDTLKNRKTLIFNHGHERKRGEACEIVKYFTGMGWVVFAPLRRGHFIPGTDDRVGIRSTGIHVDDFVTFCSRSQEEAETDPPVWVHLYRGSPFCRPGAPTDPVERRSAVELFYLREQKIDVRDAITYLKSLSAISTGVIAHNWKLVDQKSIVVLGHSYGGALTVFVNEVDYGQSVAIDIAGAELSWDNDDEPFWKTDLEAAMLNQKRPIFLLQAKNGKYLTPTKELFMIGVNKEYRIQAAIYGLAPACADNDSDGFCDGNPDTTVFKDIHSNFIGVPEQVASWGPGVIEFAKRNER